MIAKWVGQFKAEDPRIFADTATEPSFPLSGDGTDTQSVTNSGTFYTPWVATFTGAGNNFQIKSVPQNKFIKVTYTLGVSATLIIDSRRKTIRLANGTNIYQYKDATSSWFELAPGAQNIQCDITSGYGAQSKCDLSFRSGWN